MYSVYALTDPRDNQIHYIGLSKNVQERFHAHLHTLSKWGPNPLKIAWIQELLENDMSPVLSIIEEVETDEEAEQRENFWIQHYLLLNAPLTNVKGISILNRYSDQPKEVRKPIRLPSIESTGAYWTPKEIALYLGVSEETVRRYIRQKKLQAVRFGDQLRISDSALQEFIKKRNANQTE